MTFNRLYPVFRKRPTDWTDITIVIHNIDATGVPFSDASLQCEQCLSK